MTRIRRIALRVLAAIAIVLVACSAVAFAFKRKFYPSAPSPVFAPPRDAAEAQQQDLAYFRNYFELEKAYSTSARARAMELLAATEAKPKPLSSADFDLDLARIVALADNGHSRVQPLSVARRHPRLPCRLYHFDDGFRVLRARPSCAALLGAKVTAIDGRAVDDVVDGMFVYFGGPRNHYDQFAAVFFLESPELLHAAGFAREETSLGLHVVARDGTERDVTIEADPAELDAPRAYSDEYLSPRRIDGEAADWASLLAEDARLPIFLRDYGNPFQAEHWSKESAYYALFRSNADEPGHPIGPFVARVAAEIGDLKPRNVILDLRLDQGGDFTSTASFMKTLTGLSSSIEHVYVLTSAWTFSAGDVSLALLKEHGGAKVVVVGAHVGDRLRIWAEGGRVTLPNSKLAVGFATGLHDYENGCTGEEGCFWIMRFYPTHIKSFEPDVRVPYLFDDYVALRDPLVDTALKMAQVR